MAGKVKANEKKVKVAVVGGGPAGLAAALGAYEAGAAPDEILIIERDACLGGILNQCIHAGFGLHRFGEELTGPEYAERYIARVREAGIGTVTDAMVLSLDADRHLTYISPKEGVVRLTAGAVILAMGCRERTRGALNIPGTRPAGIYSAGTAQRFVNIEGVMPGKEVVILGSGDIGLIMARRMTLEGAHVKAVCELMPYSGGLARNIAQCLDDFGIPLKLSHTVVGIQGKERLTGVVIAQVDGAMRPIPGTEETVPCDTLLLSVGLIPENEITIEAGIPLCPTTGGAIVDHYRQTERAGIFACGNVLHVHDLVDYVSAESALAGRSAAAFAAGRLPGGTRRETVPSDGVRYIVPQRYFSETLSEDTEFFFRVRENYRDVTLCVGDGETVFFKKKLRRASPGEMEKISFTGDALHAARKAESLCFMIDVGKDTENEKNEKKKGERA